MKKETNNLIQKNEANKKENDKFDKKKENFIKFLTSLYQNVSTAMQSIEELQPKVENENFKKELSNQLTNYDLIARECEMIAKSEDIDIKDNNLFEKIRLWSSINLGIIKDKSIRHIAEMMLFGTVMGLIQCLKDAVDYKNICSELDDLCQKLIELEEKNYQVLKNFI